MIRWLVRWSRLALRLREWSWRRRLIRTNHFIRLSLWSLVRYNALSAVVSDYIELRAPPPSS
jgi:hypothetical protein